MSTGIIICGSAGSGKTTLGKMVAYHLGYPYYDLDDYIWVKDENSLPFTKMYSKEEKINRLMNDINKEEHFVMGGSMDSFNTPFVPLFTLAVFIDADTDERVKRIKEREKIRFGKRILPGGDLYEHHQAFLQSVRNYHGNASPNYERHMLWAKSLPCPVIYLDGNLSLESNCHKIIDEYMKVLKMKIVYATGNQHKFLEASKIIQVLDTKKQYELVLLKDEIGLKKIEEPIEDGKTFYENALLKAKYYYEKLGIPVIADDSGIIACALGDKPGIYSARYSGQNNKTKDIDKCNRERLLLDLKNETNREGYFYCVSVFYDGDKIIKGEGRVNGLIIDSEQGSNGFGYDPIFYLPDYQQTMAEVDEKVKNQLSHRYIALKDLINKMNKEFFYKNK